MYVSNDASKMVIQFKSRHDLKFPVDPRLPAGWGLPTGLQ